MRATGCGLQIISKLEHQMPGWPSQNVMDLDPQPWQGMWRFSLSIRTSRSLLWNPTSPATQPTCGQKGSGNRLY